MIHLYKEDWIVEAIFTKQEEDYNGICDDKTVVSLYCEAESTLRAENWVYGIEYATCQDCLDAYAIGVLGELP